MFGILARNPTVADAFSRELITAIDSIAEAPLRWPRLHGHFRRYLLHKFPFSVVYLEREDSVEVIAGDQGTGSRDDLRAL